MIGDKPIVDAAHTGENLQLCYTTKSFALMLRLRLILV